MRPTPKVMSPGPVDPGPDRAHRCRRASTYAQTVPKMPKGTQTRKMRRQEIGARSPPISRPRNEPAMAATLLIPRARPRWRAGKASVRMALELANRECSPPIPWNTRMMMSQRAPSVPFIQVTLSSKEKKVNRAKPRLYMRTRPNMSPTRPKLATTSDRRDQQESHHQPQEVGRVPGRQGVEVNAPEDVGQRDQGDGAADRDHDHTDRGVRQSDPLVALAGRRLPNQPHHPMTVSGASSNCCVPSPTPDGPYTISLA